LGQIHNGTEKDSKIVRGYQNCHGESLKGSEIDEYERNPLEGKKSAAKAYYSNRKEKS